MDMFNKMFGKDDKDKELRKEIQSIERRRDSVFTTINAEIARLQNQRTGLLLSAGTAAYEAWSKDASFLADLTGFWSDIQELDKRIAEQEAKKIEMGQRYNEEIQLISSNLSSNITAGSAVFRECPKCKAQISADDMFCQSCGNKMG